MCLYTCVVCVAVPNRVLVSWLTLASIATMHTMKQLKEQNRMVWTRTGLTGGSRCRCLDETVIMPCPGTAAGPHRAFGCWIIRPDHG